MEAARRIFRTALANKGYFTTLPDLDQGSNRKAVLSPVAIAYMTDLFISLLFDSNGKVRSNQELATINFVSNPYLEKLGLENLRVALGHPEVDGAAALAAYLVLLMDELGDNRNYRWGLIEIKQIVLTGVVAEEDQLFQLFNDRQIWKVYPCHTLTGNEPYPSGRPRYEDGLIRIEKITGPVHNIEGEEVIAVSGSAGYQISYDSELIEGILACEAIAAKEGRLHHCLCYNDVAMWPGIDTNKVLRTNEDSTGPGISGELIVEYNRGRMAGLRNHYLEEEVADTSAVSSSLALIKQPYDYMVVTEKFLQGFVSMYRVSYPEDPRGVNTVFRSVRQYQSDLLLPDGSTRSIWQPVTLQLEGAPTTAETTATSSSSSS